MTDETLKPCPFCGGEAKNNSHESCDCCGKHYTGIIECTKCLANVSHLDTDAEAIKAWNTRAEPNEPTQAEGWEASGRASFEVCKDLRAELTKANERIEHQEGFIKFLCERLGEELDELLSGGTKAKRIESLEEVLKMFMEAQVNCGCDPDIECRHDMARKLIKTEGV